MARYARRNTRPDDYLFFGRRKKNALYLPCDAHHALLALLSLSLSLSLLPRSCPSLALRFILLNVKVQGLHKESEEYRGATVQKLNDTSQYTVRFHDGDERILRRSAVMPMGPAHFKEGATLGNFPLTDPDTFGTAATAADASAGDSGRKRRRISDTSDGGGSGDRGGRGGTGAAVRTYGTASTPTGNYHEAVLVNPRPGDLDDEDRHWWPALVIPAAEVMRDMINSADYDPKSSSVVRFFEDNLYAIIEHKYMRMMKHNTIPLERFKKDPAFMSGKAAKRAFAYMANAKLPPSFKWKTWSDKCDLEALGDLTEDSEELYFEDDRDKGWHPRVGISERFTELFTRWMADAGTPIKRTPSVGFKDLNLYKLFTLVFLEGGHKEVSKKEVWKNVYARLTGMSLDRVPPSADKTMRTAYEKYLLAFAESDAAGEFKALAEDTKVMKTPQVVTPAEDPMVTPAADKLHEPPPAYNNPDDAAEHGATSTTAYSNGGGGGAAYEQGEGGSGAAASANTGDASRTVPSALGLATDAAAATALVQPFSGNNVGKGKDAKAKSGRGGRGKGKEAVAVIDAVKAKGKGKARGKKAISTATLASAVSFTTAAAAAEEMQAGGSWKGSSGEEASGGATAACTSEGSMQYLYSVGETARCRYKDGKRYVVRIEDREMRTCNPEDEPHPSDGKVVVHYYIHFHNWHKKFDTWAPYYQIFHEADGGSKRKARGRQPKNKFNDASPATLTAAALAAFDGEATSSADAKPIKKRGLGRWPNGKATKAKAAAKAAATARTGAGLAEAESVDQRNYRIQIEAGVDEDGGPMSDEELARIIAGHEAAHAGRRRETRRSWNASLSVTKRMPPTGTKAGRSGKKSAGGANPPAFLKSQTSEEDIMAAVENAVGVKRNKRGSSADIEEEARKTPSKVHKMEPPFSCSSSSFLNLCTTRADKNCYTPSCRANFRYWAENDADNAVDTPTRQAMQHARLQEVLKAMDEKPLQERIEFLKHRYAQHVKAVKVMKQQERADSKNHKVE